MDFDIANNIVDFSEVFLNLKRKDNSIIINAGPYLGFVYFTDDQIYNLLKDKINKNITLYFDNSSEGYLELWKVYSACKKLEIDLSNVYYFTACINFKKEYYPFIENINVVIFNYYEKKMKEFYEFKNKKYQIKFKNKNFLSFNRCQRGHRAALMTYLIEKNLLDQFYISYFADKAYYHCDFEKYMNDLNFSQELKTKIKKTLMENKDKFPLTLNLKNCNADQINPNYLFKDDFKYFEDSYLSIVTESYYDSSRYKEASPIFFTEKIFKPILAKHPFIVLGNAKYLYYLKKIGYKTFYPFIDESYDDEYDDEKRFFKVLEEIERFSKFTNDQWIEFQNNIKNIVEYNHDLCYFKNNYLVK